MTIADLERALRELRRDYANVNDNTEVRIGSGDNGRNYTEMVGFASIVRVDVAPRDVRDYRVIEGIAEQYTTRPIALYVE